jgi:hypothetical protein
MGAKKIPTQCRMTLAEKFCRCIGAVRKTVKLRNRTKKQKKSQARESAAIAICTTSILHRRGRTLKKFTCDGKKPMLKTQKPLSKLR